MCDPSLALAWPRRRPSRARPRRPARRASSTSRALTEQGPVSAAVERPDRVARQGAGGRQPLHDEAAGGRRSHRRRQGRPPLGTSSARPERGAPEAQAVDTVRTGPRQPSRARGSAPGCRRGARQVRRPPRPRGRARPPRRRRSACRRQRQAGGVRDSSAPPPDLSSLAAASSNRTPGTRGAPGRRREFCFAAEPDAEVATGKRSIRVIPAPPVRSDDQNASSPGDRRHDPAATIAPGHAPEGSRRRRGGPPVGRWRDALPRLVPRGRAPRWSGATTARGRTARQVDPVVRATAHNTCETPGIRRDGVVDRSPRSGRRRRSNETRPGEAGSFVVDREVDRGVR